MKNSFKPFGTLVFLLYFIISSCSFSGQEKEQAVVAVKEDFTDLFDGKTLNGWEGDATYWRMEDGIVVGETTLSTPVLKNNTFLTWNGGELGDFELITEYRITAQGNSGINYRSEVVENVPFALKGYQADIDGNNNYTGQNYEERKRTTLAYRGEKVSIPTSSKGKVENNAWSSRTIEGSLGNSDSLKTTIKAEDWNECHLIVKGNRLQHYVNGILMADVTDNDSVNVKLSGLLGMQIHVGPPMKVEYRNFRIKRI
ncbi:hypothetical protein AAKU52_000317 [Pedobacter sp. CG_S7]|uniref:3-keto-disaccharide hydrolase n=1 Tax=Pedobacter sp. CG_S7 TaxID=3143930 RepID=UPI003399B344